MPTHQIELINDQTNFYHCFNRTSFFERLARWSRFFSYGFLLFHLSSILVEMLQPFSVNPPDLFFQLLFLLLIWGSIELYSIPLEAIKDTCTLDYQKNWICRAQHRFFFTRVVVLASFNQIKSIGVSCRPEPLSRLLFSGSERRYAVYMLDLNNQLISLSDYNLTIGEANEFVQSLFIRHLSGTQIIPGNPGFELFFDPQTTLLASRQSTRSLFSSGQALLLSFLQAALAFAGTSVVLGSAIILLATTSAAIFNTDLQIARQPVMQLLTSIGHVHDQAVELPPPAEPPPPLVYEPPTVEFSSSSVLETASAGITIDLFTGRVISDSETEKEVPGIPLSTATTEITSEVQPVTGSESNAELVSEPAVPLQSSDKLYFDPVQSELASLKEKNSLSALSEPIMSDPAPIKLIVPASTPQNDILTSPVSKPAVVLQPLESRIPEVDPGRHGNQKTPKSFMPLQSAKVHTPAMKKIEPAPAFSAQVAATRTTRLTPGYGLPGFVLIGGSSDNLENLGKPVMTNDSQILYQGLTILKNAATGKIVSIIITTRNSPITGRLETADGLSVGSSIAEVVSLFGPAQRFDGKPGLHFPHLGISFIPSHSDPQAVGVIQLYAPGNMPR